MTRGEFIDEVARRLKERHKDVLDQPVEHYRDMATVMMQTQAEFEELLPHLHNHPVRVILEVRPDPQANPVEMAARRAELHARIDRVCRKT